MTNNTPAPTAAADAEARAEVLGKPDKWLAMEFSALRTREREKEKKAA